MEDDLKKKLEDDLKKNKKMEDDLKKQKNFSPFLLNMEDDLKQIRNGRRPKKNGRRPKKKSKISIPLKFRGKPFLGLAQLSKIFITFD
jgi:hypothetical protein